MSKALEAAGYHLWGDDDPYEAHVGPFYLRGEGDGRYSCAIDLTDNHCNAMGFAHGGCMMTFADFSLFAFARDEVCQGESPDISAVTVAFNSEFVGPARAGETLYAEGEVTRATRSLIFARGTLFVQEGGMKRNVMAFSGVLKR